MLVLLHRWRLQDRREAPCVIVSSPAPWGLGSIGLELPRRVNVPRVRMYRNIMSKKRSIPPPVRAFVVVVSIMGATAPGIIASVVKPVGGNNPGGASTASPTALGVGAMTDKLLPRQRAHEAVSTGETNSKAAALETAVVELGIEDSSIPGVPSSTRGGASEGRGRALSANKRRMLEDESVDHGCPYAVQTEKEALSRGHSSTDPGNVFEVTGFGFARLGNHFVALYRTLTLGFCCKSKMVTLPPKDDILAPGIFNRGTPGPRWFDFSGAPDVAGFNASSCPPSITWGSRDSFYQTGPMYYFPTDVDVCSSSYYPNTNGGLNGKRKNAPTLEIHVRDDHVSLDGDGGMVEAMSRSEEDDEEEEEEGGEEEAIAGGNGKGKKATANLVIHVRSGDIFVDPVHHAHGQPPLQFYLRVLHDRTWDRVDIVTNGRTDSAHLINPVIPELESRVAAGDLPGNIHFHKYRSMAEDLTSLVCADALVTARSTVFKLLAYHATATQMYVPMSCSGFLTDLQDDRPDVK
ncbi:unnamed protein product, partial [Ectocarpus fasciculatus]